MLRLTSLAIAFLVGCYEPAVQDCTIECNGGEECAGDQVCARGFCVSSASVTCDGTGSDPLQHVQLRVTVEGEGKVAITNVGTCTSGSSKEDCTWMVTHGIEVQLRAMPLDDSELEDWSGACAGQDATCTIIASSAITVGARFE